jgi:hypothetical protein
MSTKGSTAMDLSTVSPEILPMGAFVFFESSYR